jgi:hypothetical protein
MRADTVAAFLDFETTGKLWKAIARGEARGRRRSVCGKAEGASRFGPIKGCARGWLAA